VIGATENMVSSHAVRPGDIVRARAGITIEVNNPDAEGRLVLADCLTHARDKGAERLIDLATLTGGIVAALGPVHAGLMGNDDAWCDAVRAAGEAVIVVSHEPVISALGAFLLGLPAFPQFRTAQCCAIESGKPTFTARADLGQILPLFAD
jgi:hypothetical protein